MLNIPKDFKDKIDKGIKLCSKCYEELIWINGCCPKCGSKYFLPYYNNKGKELRD
jgi:hypothetical protein